MPYPMFANDPAFAPQMGGGYVVVPRPQPRPARATPRPAAAAPKPQPRPTPVPQPRAEPAVVAVRPIVVPPPEELGIRVDAGPAPLPRVTVPDAADLGISLE